MVLAYFTNKDRHTHRVPGLAYFTAENSLQGNFQAFLLSCKVDGLSDRTISNYFGIVGAFVRFCESAKIKESQKVTVHHVRMFLLSRQETCQPVSIVSYYKSVNRFFNWCITEGILKENPMATIRPSKVPRKIVKPFDQEQINTLLELCQENKFLSLRNRAIVLTFIDTGMRLSELAGIQLSDINFDDETIKIMGKGAKERFVRVGKTTQKALLRYLLARRDSYPCLWVTEERRPMALKGIQWMVRRLCQQAGIKDIKTGPHTFRHTAAINYLRNGGGEFTLQIMLGHSTLDMTRRYVSSLGAEDMIRTHKMASPVDNMKL